MTSDRAITSSTRLAFHDDFVRGVRQIVGVHNAALEYPGNLQSSKYLHKPEDVLTGDLWKLVLLHCTADHRTGDCMIQHRS